MDDKTKILDRFLSEYRFIKFENINVFPFKVIYFYDDNIKIWTRVNNNVINNLFIGYLQKSSINPYHLIDETNAYSINELYIHVKNRIYNIDTINILNSKYYLFPTSNNLIIDCQQNIIRTRTSEDYYTYFYNAKYLLNLDKDKIKYVDEFFRSFDNNILDVLSSIIFFQPYRGKRNYLFYGSGNNGKTTLINLIKKIFGKYYDNTENELNYTSIPIINFRHNYENILDNYIKPKIKIYTDIIEYNNYIDELDYNVYEAIEFTKTFTDNKLINDMLEDCIDECFTYIVNYYMGSPKIQIDNSKHNCIIF